MTLDYFTHCNSVRWHGTYIIYSLNFIMYFWLM